MKHLKVSPYNFLPKLEVPPCFSAARYSEKDGVLWLNEPNNSPNQQIDSSETKIVIGHHNRFLLRETQKMTTDAASGIPYYDLTQDSWDEIDIFRRDDFQHSTLFCFFFSTFTTCWATLIDRNTTHSSAHNFKHGAGKEEWGGWYLSSICYEMELWNIKVLQSKNHSLTCFLKMEIREKLHYILESVIGHVTCSHCILICWPSHYRI